MINRVIEDYTLSQDDIEYISTLTDLKELYYNIFLYNKKN